MGLEHMSANQTKIEIDARENSADDRSIESLLEGLDALGDAASRKINNKTSGKLADRVASLRHVEDRAVPGVD